MWMQRFGRSYDGAVAGSLLFRFRTYKPLPVTFFASAQRVRLPDFFRI
jgi:hypothetical protein